MKSAELGYEKKGMKTMFGKDIQTVSKKQRKKKLKYKTQMVIHLHILKMLSLMKT